MKDTYPAALHFVLNAEGGFSDDPSDSGGPTMRGITWRDLLGWRQAHGINLQTPSTHAAQVALIKSITDQEVADIYRFRYWVKVSGDDLPVPLDLITFDGGVNCGVGTAIKMLCEAAGLPPEIVITRTLLSRLAAEGTELPAVVEKLLSLREAYYRRIAHGHNAVFLKGWLNRVAAVRVAAHQAVVASAKPAPAKVAAAKPAAAAVSKPVTSKPVTSKPVTPKPVG